MAPFFLQPTECRYQEICSNKQQSISVLIPTVFYRLVYSGFIFQSSKNAWDSHTVALSLPETLWKEVAEEKFGSEQWTHWIARKYNSVESGNKVEIK